MDFAVHCRVVEVHQSTMQVCHPLILYVTVVDFVDFVGSYGLCGHLWTMWTVKKARTIVYMEGTRQSILGSLKSTELLCKYMTLL